MEITENPRNFDTRMHCAGFTNKDIKVFEFTLDSGYQDLLVDQKEEREAN